ncbi:MAG: PEP-CTERM sorting domain-containing protein [Verrucomicrobiota bacterium]
MKKTHTLLTLALGVLLLGGLTANSSAVVTAANAMPNVTLAPGSFGIGGIPATTADIINLPSGGPPVVLTPDGTPTVVNAHTYGRLTVGFTPVVDLDVAYFTGVAGGAGASGGFAAETGVGDESAGIFSSGTLGVPLPPLGPGSNTTFANVAGTAPYGGTGLTGGGGDVINSLDILGPAGPQDVYFSLVASADIFASPPPASDGPYVGSGSVLFDDVTDLGLLSGDDDIDALEIVSTAAGTAAFFSLTSTSSALAGVAPVYGGGSGADIFLFDPAGIIGAPGLSKYLDAAGLGLGVGDEVTGFSLAPEPSRALFLLLGTMGIVLRRRRRA